MQSRAGLERKTWFISSSHLVTGSEEIYGIKTFKCKSNILCT